MSLEDKIAALAERAMDTYRRAGDEYGEIADAMNAAMMFYRAYRAERLLREAEVSEAKNRYDEWRGERTAHIRAQAAALVESD